MEMGCEDYIKSYIFHHFKYLAGMVEKTKAKS